MDEGRREGPERIRSRLEPIRQVEAEHDFGVITEGTRNPDPVAELPQGATEVFGPFSRLGADHFPLLSARRDPGRSRVGGPGDRSALPPGSPLTIGCERHSAPEDIECGSGIWLAPDESTTGGGTCCGSCAVAPGPVALCTQTAGNRPMRLAARPGSTAAERFEGFGAEQWFGVRSKWSGVRSSSTWSLSVPDRQGWIFLFSASMATYFSMRAARVSGFFASWIR
ncbi:hypothetical protein GCM10010266_59350 [Streptomyces griseomycini]|uniref:Uncharacterized protein n=1 Tax=Streptomyces griseomycini TaxID=66895 RepID=A0A7W7LZC6_9ACTN|nr:hypothetical protein [Streptomyces griseomycini]MBB4899288.1 hypothetical protein [Streptomyces griseomycini]GGQ28158.1 hypothetical protein GCM10010266_59350 [Streptomyces griseomycini]GGR35314.1 hypothetical protein GCM10015536_46180 [Streptomyces griseomycini]